MVSLNSTDGALATAQTLAGMGFNVLPAKFKDKAPIIPWSKYQFTRTDRLLPSWFGGTRPFNYWVMTGRMSMIVVLDCDNEAGYNWWEERLTKPVMDAAARVSTSKGHHYYFKIPEDWDMEVAIPSWSVHVENGPSFDVRADATGVIAPPSTHASGHVYEWETPMAQAAVASPELLDGSYRTGAPSDAPASGEGTRKDSSGVTRSLLSALIDNPPGDEGSGRNDWLARVAGHYAKTYHNFNDLYLAHCRAANRMMSTPLDEAEFDKTVESLWRGEQDRNPQRACDVNCGWLLDAGSIIMTQIVTKGANDEKVFDLAPYCNFNLTTHGVMIEEDGRRTYWVKLLVDRGRGAIDQLDLVLSAKVLGDERSLATWLASYGVNILPPDNMWPKSGKPTLRIQRYLESQHPPEVSICSTLGWDEEILSGAGGFVTHDGVITQFDVKTADESGVRANPMLRSGGIAPHRYGFEKDGFEAKRVLREVMTFHEESLTSVFGAWWAACLVKPQIEDNSSLFPFVAIEAPSESGKTNGFFDMMVQLNGNTRGESQSTKAALRDMASAHKNGIVWIDDMNDLTELMELLRAATSGGTITKMAEDRISVKNAKIVSPIVISGETLGINSQKALLDRAIGIKATSPTARRSLHNPDRPQWDDVLLLKNQYKNGLADIAGWLVQDALSQVPNVVKALEVGRTAVGGRMADKIAIIRAGAKLLDHLIADTPDEMKAAWRGEGHNTFWVEKWVTEQTQSGISSFDNSLTLRLIPWALRRFDYADKPYARKFADQVDTPVFVKQPNGVAYLVHKALGEPTDGNNEPEIWFSTVMLAEAWSKANFGRIDQRTESYEALKGQAAVFPSRGKQWRITGSNSKAYYSVIRGEMAQRLLDRAEGSDE